MSRRKDQERAEAGIIYRSGRPVSRSAWERQQQSAMADLKIAAEKGVKELGHVFAILAHTAGICLPVTDLRNLAKISQKHGSTQQKQ